MGLFLLVPHIGFHIRMGAQWSCEHRGFGSKTSATGTFAGKGIDVAYQNEMGESILVAQSSTISRLGTNYAQTVWVPEPCTNA